MFQPMTMCSNIFLHGLILHRTEIESRIALAKAVDKNKNNIELKDKGSMKKKSASV